MQYLAYLAGASPVVQATAGLLIFCGFAAVALALAKALVLWRIARAVRQMRALVAAGVAAGCVRGGGIRRRASGCTASALTPPDGGEIRGRPESCSAAGQSAAQRCTSALTPPDGAEIRGRPEELAAATNRAGAALLAGFLGKFAAVNSGTDAANNRVNSTVTATDGGANSSARALKTDPSGEVAKSRRAPANFPALCEPKPSAQILEKHLENELNLFALRLNYALGVFASLGNLAPFIGLFGTVWGILATFESIAGAGNSSLEYIAPHISESLFATALGLLVAIPSVAVYNTFTKLCSRIAAEAQYALNAYLIGVCEEAAREA